MPVCFRRATLQAGLEGRRPAERQASARLLCAIPPPPKEREEAVHSRNLLLHDRGRQEEGRMDALQLVELRKQGSISQEEFFVSLNLLRRKNSEAHQRDCSESRDPAKAAGVVDTDTNTGGNDDDGVEEEDCGDGDGQSGIDAAAGPMKASEPVSAAARVASAEEKPLSSEDRHQSELSESGETRRDGGAFISDHSPAAAAEAAEELLLSGDVQQQLREELRDPGAVSAEIPRLELVSRSLSSKQSKPQPRLSDADDVVQNNRPQTPPRARCWANGAGDHQGAGARRGEEGGDCDSGWLVSPSGESRQRSTSSRPRRSRTTDNTNTGEPQRHHVFSRTCEGDEVKLRGTRTSPAGQRLSSRGGVGGPQAAKPNLRPVGRSGLIQPREERPNDGRLSPRPLGGGNSPEDSNHNGNGEGGALAELSPRRCEEVCAATQAAVSFTTTGGGLDQSHLQHSGGGGMSGQHSSSTPVAPLRSRSPGAGPLEGDEATGEVSHDPREGASPKRCGEGRAGPSTVARSPAKPGWRPTGGALAQPSSQRGGGCGGGVSSQPAARPLSSSRSTACDPTLATVDDVIVGRRAEGSKPGGDRHASRHRVVQGSFDSGPLRVAPTPPPPQQQQQLRPEGCEQPPARAAASAAQGAPAPVRAPASAMVRVGASPMVPYTSRQRRSHATVVAAAALRGERSPENGGHGVDVGHQHHHARGLDLTRSGGDRAPLSDSAGILWRSRDRHRESLSSPARWPRRDSRRRSSNMSAASFDSGRYYTTAVRCDRFGYPLHDRECLGSSGPTGGAGVGPIFSPTIKGLPDFYESRPRRIGGARHTETEKQSPASLYTRTTDWQARASELRARKLAQREEQEMEACTFQPNVPPRQGRAAYAAATSRAAGRTNTDSHFEPAQDGGEGGVGRDGSDGGGGGGGRGGDGRIAKSIGAAVGESRPSGAGGKGYAGLAGMTVVQRLFEETRRLEERRFEGLERKRMGEEETYARTCTFEPSLEQTAAINTLVPSRYRDAPRAASAPPTGRRKIEHEAPTFHPKIVGVKPGMTRALEYISLGVMERLYRPHPSGAHGHDHGYHQGSDYSSDRSSDYSTGAEGRPPEGFDHSTQRRGRGGDRLAAKSLRSASSELNIARRHRNGGGSFGGRPGETSGVAPPPPEGPGRRHFNSSSSYSSYSRSKGAESLFPSRRPRSAPPTRGGEGRAWRQPEDDEPSGRWDGRGGAGGEERQAGRTDVYRRGGGWIERDPDGAGGGGSAGGAGPRRQKSISFREFLARQAQSQIAAEQHLRRLTAQQSPSFTPRLSRGTRRLAARGGGAAAAAGGGRFEERLNMTARRRSRDRKAAITAARKLEEQTCTFSPRLSTRARTARSRSARELSLGDSVLRAAKLRMTRAREDIRLLDNPDGDGNADCPFEPTFATAGDDGLAPPALSRLRLADELDTYIDRVQEAAAYREERLFRQRQRQRDLEEGPCTFRPEITARCPELVRRTAAGMRCAREFRRKQAALEAREGGRSPPPARPSWRYN